MPVDVGGHNVTSEGRSWKSDEWHWRQYSRVGTPHCKPCGPVVVKTGDD